MAENFEITGLRELIARLESIAGAAPSEAARALYEEANLVMTVSKERCPVAPDGGTLRASGTVDEPVVEGRDISVRLSYGGAASDYALAVHEHPSEHSPHSWKVAEAEGRGIHWNAAGTGPKFLEGPVQEARAHLGERLADRIDLNRRG